MALTPMADFPFKHVNQTDQVSGDPTAFKTNMDSQAKAIRDFMIGTQKTEIDGIAGVGRTTETVKGNADALIEHQADDAKKNYITNGNFDVWQRGTTFTSVFNVYTADRWTLIDAGGSSADVTQMVAGAAEHAILPDAKYYLRLNRKNAILGNLEQRIEDVRTLQGKTVTLSYYAKANANHTANVMVVQNFGSGGSADVVALSLFVNITTAWQRFVNTFTIPSTDGLTIGSNSRLFIDLARGATINTYDIMGVKLEIGSNATRFEPKIFSEELGVCQRYRRNIETLTYLSSVAYGANEIYFWLPLAPSLRVSPTLVLGVETTDWQIITPDFSAQTGFSLSIESTSTKGILIKATKASHGLTSATLKIVTDINVLDAEL